MKILILLFIFLFFSCKTIKPNDLVHTSFKSKYKFNCSTEIYTCLRELRESNDYLYFLSDFPDSIVLQEESNSCHEVIIFRSWLGMDGSLNNCDILPSDRDLYGEFDIKEDEILLIISINPKLKMSIFGEFYNNSIVGLFSIFLPIPHYNRRPYSYKIAKIEIDKLEGYINGTN